METHDSEASFLEILLPFIISLALVFPFFYKIFYFFILSNLMSSPQIDAKSAILVDYNSGTKVHIPKDIKSNLDSEDQPTYE